MRDVTISKVMNGFIVKVGCQTLVFQEQTAMIVELNNYLTNPEETEKRFVEKFGYAGGQPLGGADVNPAPTPYYGEQTATACTTANRTRY
jgi:hypothetical protein